MNHTMAKQNSKSTSIAGSSDNRSITGTFTITLNSHFLPMQLICGGKAKQSLPRFKFPVGFLLSCNTKHFNNGMESIKLIDEIFFFFFFSIIEICIFCFFQVPACVYDQKLWLAPFSRLLQIMIPARPGFELCVFLRNIQNFWAMDRILVNDLRKKFFNIMKYVLIKAFFKTHRFAVWL